jgi:predicted ATPase
MQVKPYLKETTLKRDLIEDSEAYPFCIPGVRNLSSLKFHPDVTFFIKKVKYEQTEHYSITRQFLNGYQQLLELLMEK